MVDGGSGEAPSSLGRRIAVVVSVTVVTPLLLLLYAFHLLWFSPEITSSGECDPSEFGVIGGSVCGPEHGRVLWLGTFLVFVTVAFCLVMTWVRTLKPGRWWPWPATTVVISVGWYVVQQTWLF